MTLVADAPTTGSARTRGGGCERQQRDGRCPCGRAPPAHHARGHLRDEGMGQVAAPAREQSQAGPASAGSASIAPWRASSVMKGRR
jgi:hypothetical protein